MIINKFNGAKKYKALDKIKDIFVLIDKSHHTEYGELSNKICKVMPNTCYIGFIGMSFIKNEKVKTKFNGYIRKYTIKDVTDDGAIAPLIHEVRFEKQDIDGESIDIGFEKYTQNLTDAKKWPKKWME